MPGSPRQRRQPSERTIHGQTEGRKGPSTPPWAGKKDERRTQGGWPRAYRKEALRQETNRAKGQQSCEIREKGAATRGTGRRRETGGGAQANGCERDEVRSPREHPSPIGSGRNIAYILDGTIRTEEPDDEFEFTHDSTLNPVPGRPGEFR